MPGPGTRVAGAGCVKRAKETYIRWDSADYRLREAIVARIDDGRDIPSPSASKRGELTVSIPPSMALKAAVYLAVREAAMAELISAC